MHDQPLEIPADRQVVGHAHAAVQLHGLLADVAARLPDHDLGGRNRSSALAPIGFVDPCGGQQGRGARLLDRDRHVGGAVLQRLEVADRLAELLARPQVLGRHLEQALHHADRFGTEPGDAAVDGALEFVVAVVQRAEQRAAGDRDVIATASRPHAGRRWSALARICTPCGVDRYQEQRDALLVASCAAGARRHDQAVRAVCTDDDGLASGHHVALARRVSPWSRRGPGRIAPPGS